MSKIKLAMLLLFSAPALTQNQDDDKKGIIQIELPDAETEKAIDKAVQKRLDKLNLPISPNKARDLIERREKTQAVTVAPIYPVSDFASKTVIVDLRPGKAFIPIALSPGLPVSLTLKNQRGEAVNWVFASQSRALSVFKPGQQKAQPVKNSETGEAGKPADTADTVVHHNMAIFKPNVIEAQGNVLMVTELSDLPLSVGYRIGRPDKPYVDRYVVIINDPSLPDTEAEVTLDDRTELLRVLNWQAPGDNYRQVPFDYQNLTAWDDGHNLWVRTKARLLGARLRQSGSLSGVNAYKISSRPALTLLDRKGRIFTAQKVLDE